MLRLLSLSATALLGLTLLMPVPPTDAMTLRGFSKQQKHMVMGKFGKQKGWKKGGKRKWMHRKGKGKMKGRRAG